MTKWIIAMKEMGLRLTKELKTLKKLLFRNKNSFRLTIFYRKLVEVCCDDLSFSFQILYNPSYSVCSVGHEEATVDRRSTTGRLLAKHLLLCLVSSDGTFSVVAKIRCRVLILPYVEHHFDHTPCNGVLLSTTRKMVIHRHRI